jgi:hypothetical protein
MEMMLRMALIAAIFCAAVPAWSQTQPGTPATPPPQHIPGQTGAKAPEATPADKPAEKLDPAKEAAIRHLMDITETSKLGENMNAAVIRQVHDFISQALPQEQVPKFMDTFSQKYTASAPTGPVTDAMVPIYARNFTMEEIQQLTKFYESPLGQHLVKVMPKVVGESQAAGARIDQPLAVAALRSMETDYPQIKQMLPAERPAPASDAAPAAPANGAATAPPRLSPAPSTTPSTTPATPPQK